MEEMTLKQRKQAVRDRLLDKRIASGWDPYSKGRMILLGFCVTLILMTSASESVLGFAIAGVSAVTVVSLIQGIRWFENR